MATLTVPSEPVSAREDAIALFRAFQESKLNGNQETGSGCDVKMVIDIIAHRDATKRDQIQHEYKTMYSEELLRRLSSELSGKLETSVLLWMHNPVKRDAIILKQALSGNFRNLEAAGEIICSRTPSQIQTLKQTYYSLFGTHLDNDIERQTSGDLKKESEGPNLDEKHAFQLLLACVNTTRPEDSDVDKEMVQIDAVALYEAGEKKLGTDEETFIRILSERSNAHLASVNLAYKDMYGNSLKKAVKKETSGKFEYALVTILQCAENPAKYFAKVLYKAMKGLGTDDTTLIRVIVTRTEIDMQHIKSEFLKKYNKSLNNWVSSEASGNYRSFLLSLLGPDD